MILVSIDAILYCLGFLRKTNEMGVKWCPELIISTGPKPSFHGQKQAIAFRMIIFAFSMTSMD